MRTLDPNIEHLIAQAREQLQTQLIYLENALDQQDYRIKTTVIFDFTFFIVGTELHFTQITDPDAEISAYEILNNAGYDSVYLNNLSQAIMNWFTNPTYQD